MVTNQNSKLKSETSFARVELLPSRLNFAVYKSSYLDFTSPSTCRILPLSFSPVSARIQPPIANLKVPEIPFLLGLFCWLCCCNSFFRRDLFFCLCCWFLVYLDPHQRPCLIALVLEHRCNKDPRSSRLLFHHQGAAWADETGRTRNYWISRAGLVLVLGLQ